ncbi:hypothetical protein ACFJIV_29130 [Mucilaginibacter sp. UC70_90]
MQVLKEKLQAYISVNNPDLLIRLQADYSMSRYLEDKISKAMPLILDLLAQDKPGHVIEELVMNELTADLRPSRYLYVLRLLEERFAEEHGKLKTLGVLQYVTLQLLDQCQPVFDEHHFSIRNQHDAYLEAKVRARIRAYLKG